MKCFIIRSTSSLGWSVFGSFDAIDKPSAIAAARAQFRSRYGAGHNETHEVLATENI